MPDPGPPRGFSLYVRDGNSVVFQRDTLDAPLEARYSRGAPTRLSSCHPGCEQIDASAGKITWLQFPSLSGVYYGYDLVTHRRYRWPPPHVAPSLENAVADLEDVVHTRYEALVSTVQADYGNGDYAPYAVVAYRWRTRTAATATVVVPHATNVNLDVAYARLRRAGLRVSYPRTFSAGSLSCWPTIERQFPRVGRKVPKGTVVELRAPPPRCGISSPGVPVGRLPSARVPDFAGWPISDAVAWAERHRLYWQVNRLPPLPAGDAPHLLRNYRVTGQRPAPGQVLALGVATGEGGFAPTPLTVRGKLASGGLPARRSGASTVSAACRLNISYLGSTAGTGLVFAYFRVHNHSRRRCRVSRYPSIELFGPAGRPLHRQQYNDGSPLVAVRNPVTTLMATGFGHFFLVFRPLTPSGAHRCNPAARAATIRLSHSASANVALPTGLNKAREPINPCTGFSVTRIAPGP